MADYWTTPKTNWVTTDGIGYGDLNRIEQNTIAVKDGTYRYVQGFGFSINNAVAGQDGVITIYPGSCYSSPNIIPMRLSTVFLKNLKSWTQGNGATYGGMAPGVVVAAETWYYIFALTDPTNGNMEIMFDDNAAGSNVSNIVYTEKRFVGCFMTALVGTEASFNLREMFSFGDGHTYINPTDIYDEGSIITSGSLPNNAYALKDLVLNTTKKPLPAIFTRARLNVITEDAGGCGLINTGGFFSIPTNLTSGGYYYGDWIGRTPTSGADDHDIEMVINGSSQIYVAMANSPATMEIRVRGFYTDRII